ncbi:putative ribonuclease H protein, partial [Ananas comosus]
PPLKEAWWRIIQKIQHRVNGWQAKLLSRGSRLVLVNAVLTNLPLYFISRGSRLVLVSVVLTNLPLYFMSVIKRIEATRRDFFWNSGSNSSGKGCLVAWKNVCRSKIEDMLGILNLAIMNRALLAKW